MCIASNTGLQPVEGYWRAAKAAQLLGMYLSHRFQLLHAHPQTTPHAIAGRVVSKSGVGAMSPGLTPESIVTLYVEIDGDAPENAKPLQSAEDAGMITVETLPLDRLHESLTELEAQGFGIWVGLWSIAQALKMRSWLGL